jgi:hypothetical protein
MSNELFVELSDEQQELIAGGDAALQLANLSLFATEINKVGGRSNAVATPFGAVASSEGYATDLNTVSASLSYLQAAAN